MERILIGVAWPYANGPLHLGHIAGCYLPADIFARYHRLKGNQVLMVSGSDQHGTPITLRAEEEGVSPQVVVDRYHRQFLDCWQRLGISFDLFTSTGTANHSQVARDIFLRLYQKGYIYQGQVSLPYCPRCQRFLPDRYVEGTCPLCGYTPARGDQCDQCGKPLNPIELVAPRCRICGTTPQVRESEHLFLRLSAFQGQLTSWVRRQGHWRPSVLNFTLRYLEEGLKDRAISRDILWGVPIPLPGYEAKRLYVWFEAVIGYLSASKEWAKAQGNEEAWRPFWEGDARAYYFLGKDNIPFHTMIWPAMLMGYGGLNLPYDVPANEFLTLEGRKLSTSRNWAIWLPEYLERYQPDPLRYFLAINMPEAADTDFSWSEFFRRNNDELVATYGNLVHRSLTFTYRHFGGRVPEPGALNASGQALLHRAERTLETVGQRLAECHFREGIKEAFALAQEANRYLDQASPWRSLKKDQREAATSLWVILTVLSALKTVLYPYLPFSSRRLHSFLGFPGEVDAGGWRLQPVPPGQQLLPPEPLFTKLEPQLAEGEVSRLRAAELLKEAL